MFNNNYRDGNKGFTLMGIRRLGKIDSSKKQSLKIHRNIRDIQNRWLRKLKEGSKIFILSGKKIEVND